MPRFRLSKHLLLLVFTTCFLIPPSAQAESPEIANLIQSSGAPGMAIVEFDTGGITAEYYFGHDSNGTPITAESLFTWGSVSKSITATAVLQLADKKLLNLNDLVVDHFPEFIGTPFGTNGATISDLIHHTSGLPRDLTKLSQHPLTESVVTEIAKLSTVNKPGTWSYSNPGYLLLHQLIMRVTGTSDYSDYLNREVISPTGAAPILADVNSVNTLVPDGHASFFGFTLPRNTRLLGPEFFGAGGLSGTGRQLAHIGIWQLNQHRQGKLPSNFPKVEARSNFDHPSYYGAGLVYDNGIVWHTGGQPGGYKTKLVFSPDTGTGLVLLYNRYDAGMDYDPHYINAELALQDSYFGTQTPRVKRPPIVRIVFITAFVMVALLLVALFRTYKNTTPTCRRRKTISGVVTCVIGLLLMLAGLVDPTLWLALDWLAPDALILWHVIALELIALGALVVIKNRRDCGLAPPSTAPASP